VNSGLVCFDMLDTRLQFHLEIGTILICLTGRGMDDVVTKSREAVLPSYGIWRRPTEQLPPLLT
jgi:hypothetical protein